MDLRLPASASREAWLLADLLKAVSRSFYLTLRVLPPCIRRPIGLAYLLARTTDTVADTEILPVKERLDVLSQLHERIQGRQREPLELGAMTQRQDLDSERLLLEHLEESLAILDALEPDDRDRVRDVLQVITSGQELDLRRFATADSEQLVALQSDDELDDYRYRVAGCVGEFWTRVCRAHLYADQDFDEAVMVERGVRLGKALQLINILRDLPRDLRMGRCYLPEARLIAVGLRPEDLLDAARMPRFLPVLEFYLDRAWQDLQVGWIYTLALPASSIRVRLACAWPILIGARTLQLLRDSNVLDPGQRVKISRGAVYRILLNSLIRYPWRGAWKNLFPKRNLVRSASICSKPEP